MGGVGPGRQVKCYPYEKKEGGGEAPTVLAMLKGEWGTNSFGPAIFPFCSPPSP